MQTQKFLILTLHPQKVTLLDPESKTSGNAENIDVPE